MRRKWISLSLIICLMLSGCLGGRNKATPPTGSPGAESLAIPAPYSQDQDIGLPLNPVSPPIPSPLNEAIISPTPTLSAPPSPVPSPITPLPSPSVSTAPNAAAPTPTIVPSPATAAPKKAKQASKSDQIHKESQSKAAAGKEKDTSKAQARSYSLTELRRKYSQSFIFEGSKERKQIALTFDDAPDTEYTPKVLDILHKHGVKATFFVVGYKAAEHPEVVKRMIREGHVVGNHSYGHTQLKKLSQPKFIQEIEKTEQVLSPIIGYTPRLVRPPYGAINDDELAWLAGNGYLTVNWNVDPEDWRGVPKETVLKRSLDGAAPGAIILMHSATGTGGSLQGTVDALPEVITGLKSKGYKLVTLTELLKTAKSK